MVTDTEPEKVPPLGVTVGVATVEATVGLTVRLKAVVFVTPPPADVTVIGKLPVDVDPVVLTVSVEEHVGLQEADEKDPVAPEGRPETVNETAWLLPELRFAVIAFETDEPATTEIFPALASAKSKLLARANHALASELCKLFLNALAFTRALVAIVKGAEYFLDDCVGEVPSIV